MRSRRERTSAYSVATKNAFIRMSAGTPTSRTTTTARPAGQKLESAWYFEVVLGRASASDRRLPEGRGVSERVIQAHRAITFVLPDHHHASAGAGDPRPPGIPAPDAGVAEKPRPAALHAAAHRDGAHDAPAGARVLEGDEHAAAAGRADRRRERRYLAAAVRVHLAVLRARRGDEDVVLLVRLRGSGVALAPVGPGDERLPARAERRIRGVGQLLLVRAVARDPLLGSEARAAVGREP